MIALRRIFIIPVIVLTFALALIGIGCGGGVGGIYETPSDEQQVIDVIKRQEEAFNNKDWRTSYQTMSPNYRKTCPYDEYVQFMDQVWSWWQQYYGPGRLKTNVKNVRVEGQFAYVIVEIAKDSQILVPANPTDPDTYRKVDGKWFDIADEPGDPGYNADDLAPSGTTTKIS
jgi:hypothetical protein